MHQTPPFDASAARRLRVALGMAPGHVAYALQAQYGLYVLPDTVAAWERGTATPDPRQLAALAGVLWCSPGELLHAPVTLREHRIARGLRAEDLARRTGVAVGAYLRMEEDGRWRGTERQSAALAEALGLDVRGFVAITGREEELTGLIRDAVTTRWQAYVRPIGKLVPLPRPRLEAVLRELHADYQSLMVATTSWGASTTTVASASGDSGRDFLQSAPERFWYGLTDG